jgi:hypothetical protein
VRRLALTTTGGGGNVGVVVDERERGMRSMARGDFAAWLLAAAASGLGGCAGVVAPTTRTAVDTSLGTLAEPQNRQEIEKILRSDEVARATRGLTRAVIDEALSGGGPGSDARLTQAANDFARDISPALGKTLDDVVLPRVQAAIATNVRASLDQFLDDGNRQRIAAFTADVAGQTAERVGPTIEASITRGITSAVERILQHDLSPAIGKVLDDNTPALARTTRAITAAALDGVNDAMAGPFGEMFRKERAATIAQVQAAEAQQQQRLIADIERQLAESKQWLVGLLAVVGVAILAIGAVLWHLLAEHRRLRERLAPGGGVT